MTAVFKQKGDAIDYTPATDVAAGSVVVLGEMVGVAKLDIKADALGALHVSGIFDFPKAVGSGTAIDAGAKTYWNDTAKVATHDDNSGTNKYLGKATSEASDEATTVHIRLDQ